MKNLCLFSLCLFTMIAISCSKKETKDPAISGIQLCTSVNSSNGCNSTSRSFDINTAQIVAAATIADPMPGVRVTFSWYYLTGQILFAEASDVLSNVEGSAQVSIPGYVTIPNNGWPEGDYEVTITLDNGSNMSTSFSIY